MILIHHKSLQRLKSQFQMASYYKTIPYELNQATGCLQVYKRFQDKLLYQCSFWLVFLYSALVHVRFYEMLLTKDLQTVNKVQSAIHFAWVAGSTLYLVGNCCLYYRKMEVATFVNAFLVFIYKIQGKLPMFNCRLIHLQYTIL